MYFDMSERTTIKLKGTKNVKISKFGNVKSRVSVILTIAVNDYKLAPILIFKGQPGKTNEKKLQEIDVKNFYLLLIKFLG